MYRIRTIERKTSKTGKNFASVSFESGEAVSIWQDFPNFSGLMAGMDVEGSIVTNDRGYKTLYPPKPSRSNGFNATKAVELKNKNIEKSMEHKDWGIMTSSTMRDAVLIVTTFYKDLGEADIADKVSKWRGWLVENWEIDKTDKPPF